MDQASHLEKLEKVFEFLDESRITLIETIYSFKKNKIGFSSDWLIDHIISKEKIDIDSKK